MRPMPDVVMGGPDTDPVRLLWDLVERCTGAGFKNADGPLAKLPEFKAVTAYLGEVFPPEVEPAVEAS